MNNITREDWLVVWERVSTRQKSEMEFSPREQVRQFEKHVSRIESRAAELAERLESKTVWIGANMPRSEAIASVQSAIRQLVVIPGEQRPSCQAAIGGDVATIRAAQALNEEKVRFRKFCLQSDARALAITRDSRPYYNNVNHLQAELCDRPNFDYLLACQQINCESGLPSVINFREAIVRRTNRISRSEVLARLGRLRSEAAARDIERVRKTPAAEERFAIDGPTRLGKHAYVVFDGMDRLGRTDRTIHTNLPVLFRLGRRLPTVSYSGDPGVRSFPGRKRPMVAICKERFLETLPVYRYLA